MGRAAELCHTPIEAFMEYASEHEVPLHYGIAELEEPAHLGEASLVTVVSDSSPLVTPARIRCFDLLPKLSGRIYISTEVYNEVFIDGAGLPGATQAAQADSIELRPVQNAAGLAAAIAKIGLGAGELSAVVLAKEISPISP